MARCSLGERNTSAADFFRPFKRPRVCFSAMSRITFRIRLVCRSVSGPRFDLSSHEFCLLGQFRRRNFFSTSDGMIGNSFFERSFDNF